MRFARKFVEDMQEEHCDSNLSSAEIITPISTQSLATFCHELEIPCYMVHNTEDIKEDRETSNSRIIRQMGVVETSHAARRESQQQWNRLWQNCVKRDTNRIIFTGIPGARAENGFR